jgi:hypothetical protein
MDHEKLRRAAEKIAESLKNQNNPDIPDNIESLHEMSV